MVEPELRGLVGMGFINHGRQPDNGLDCWGFVMEVFKRYGIILPDFQVSAFDYETIDELAHKVIGFNSWREISKPVDADVPLVALMRIHPMLITHAGVFVGKNRIIHMTKHAGAIISKITRLQSRITGYYRYVESN